MSHSGIHVELGDAEGLWEALRVALMQVTMTLKGDYPAGLCSSVPLQWCGGGTERSAALLRHRILPAERTVGVKFEAAEGAGRNSPWSMELKLDKGDGREG